MRVEWDELNDGNEVAYIPLFGIELNGSTICIELTVENGGSMTISTKFGSLLLWTANESESNVPCSKEAAEEAFADLQASLTHDAPNAETGRKHQEPGTCA